MHTNRDSLSLAMEQVLAFFFSLLFAMSSSGWHLLAWRHDASDATSNALIPLQNSAKKWSLGFVNAAGKARQKW